MLDAPAWLEALSRTLEIHATSPESRFAQLATTDDQGRPSNRTLVFRRFGLERQILLFTTDARSEKAIQITSRPWSELCWWFPATREQFRISGRAYLSNGSDSVDFALAREAIWSELKDAAKRSFTWPVPGLPFADPSEFTSPAPLAIPPQFALLALIPYRVDHLDLKPDPHIREVHTSDGSSDRWLTSRVNP